MLKITIYFLSFCCGSLLALPALDETIAKKFIIDTSDKFAEFYNTMADISFQDLEFPNKPESEIIVRNITIQSSEFDWTSDELTGFSAFLVIAKEIAKLTEATDNVTALCAETYKFSVEQFKDEETKNGILTIRTVPRLCALGDKYTEWSEDDFSDYLDHDNYCKYNEDKSKCDSAIYKLLGPLGNSTNNDELVYNWIELRERNLQELTKKLNKFINLYQDLGKKIKVSAKFAWFSTMLDENFDIEMEKVMIQMQPLYKEFHAYLRQILQQQYGEEIVNPNGYIPHHLYEQMMHQVWKPNSVAAKEFKGVKMPIDGNFKLSTPEIIEHASNFMKSLGLSELSEDFWSKRVKEQLDTTHTCDVDVYDSIGTPYLKYCKEVNVRRFLQMFSYVARIYYANERKHLPFAFSEPNNFVLATGEAVLLAASTPKYLHQIGHKDVDVLPESEDMNRLFRMSLHTLLTVPEFFVHTKVIADVLDSKVPFNEINKHYWDLMKKYVGVAPPVERSAEAIDLPPRLFQNIENNHEVNKFVSEVIGYQIYETMCKKSGQYVKGDKNHQLHNCNFYNSKEAGNTLKEMMQLGCKKPWKKLLSVISGDESGMKAEPMLEYFEPLQKWFNTKNQEYGVKVGWD